MIYLDHNATSPLRPEVLEAMMPWLGRPANPSSVHRAGQQARAAVERAREQVGALLGRSAAGVVFTSGATEANQTWWHGVVAQGVRHLATSAVEHPCVLGAAARAEASGASVQRLGVDEQGQVDLSTLHPHVQAVSLQAANHETGVLQPLDAVPPDRLLHVDATQAAGRFPLELRAAHAVAISGHKLGGPSGVGALSLLDGEAFPALLVGGSQERGRRAGTVNVAGVVGLGAACALAAQALASRTRAWTHLRGELELGLVRLGCRIVGSGVPRVPQTTCAVLPVGPSELVVQTLDLRGFAVSSGAACASGSQEPSPVLTAMGDPGADRSLRVSLGPDTTMEEVQALLAALAEVLPLLRDLD